jgi:lipopolysaccharide export system permease protein
MRLSWTLSVYLGRQFFTSASIAMLSLSILIFLFDVIELLRRASGEDIGFGVIVGMSLLQLPTLMQKLLPFATLFGGMFAFARLTRTNELVVARAAGISVWQFMMPAFLITFFLGTFVVTVFNPLAALMAERHELLDARHFQGRPTLLSVTKTGLWFRHATDEGHAVLHARAVSQQGVELQGVIIIEQIGPDDTYMGRVDAEVAILRKGYWDLTNATISPADGPPEKHLEYQLPTTLTLGQMQDSFASPETISFWSLPRFIALLTNSGFAAVKHRLHWHTILSVPLLLFAMVLIAATFSLRLTRRGGTGLLITGGIMAGFLFFILSDVFQAFGLSGKIPPVLAAWTPAGISTLIGLSMMFHLEDG